MVLVALLNELSRPSSPSGLLHGIGYSPNIIRVNKYKPSFCNEQVYLSK